MKVWFFVLLALLAMVLPARQQQQQCVFEKKFEYDDDCRGNVKIKTIVTTSEKTCCARCNETKGCVAWTHDLLKCHLYSAIVRGKFSSTKTSGRMIRLPILPTLPSTFSFGTTTLPTLPPFSFGTTTTPSTTTRINLPTLPPIPSGTTKTYQCFVEFGARYTGGELTSVYAASPMECCNKCGAYPGCVAFNFIGNFCTFRNQLPVNTNRVVDSTATSGRLLP